MDQPTATRPTLAASQFGLAALLALLTALSVALAVYVRYYLLGVICLAMTAGVTLIAIGAARKRTGLIGLGALAASVCLVLLILGGARALWIGQSLVSLTFVIVDHQTGKPLPGATVNLRELPFEAGTPPLEIAPGEAGVEARADARGRVTITYKFMTSGQSGLLVRDTANAVLLDGFFVQASAPGHQTRVVPLIELAGRSLDIAWPQQRPPIEFRLEQE
jgi:hypothetical protein